MAVAAAITGQDGSVTIPAAAGGQTGLIYRWNARFEREIHDVSTFDDATAARTKAGGMMKLVGSCDAYFNGTTPAITTAPVTSGVADADQPVVAGFFLKVSTSRHYSFSGIISSIRIVTEKAGQCVVTMNFQSGWLTGAAPLADILAT